MQSGLLRRINYPLPRIILGTQNWGELVDLPEARSQLRTYLEAGGFALELGASGKGLAIAGELLAELTNRDHFQIHLKLPQISNSSQAHSAINHALTQTNLDHFDIIWTSFDIQQLTVNEIIQLIKHNLQNSKARYFGLNHTEFWQIVYLQEQLNLERITLAGLRTTWSLLERQLSASEMGACEFLNISLVATKSLGLGLLSGKYRFNTPSDSMLARGSSDLDNLLTTENASKIEALATAADGIGVSPTEVTLAWLLAKPQVTSSVINVRNTAQLNQIVESLKLDLPSEIQTALDEVGNFE